VVAPRGIKKQNKVIMKCSATCVTGKKCKRTATHGEVCWTHSIKEMNDCGICLEESILTSKYNKHLDCGHIFCTECIFKWIVEKGNKSNCPVCRKDINDYHIMQANSWGIKNKLLYYCEFTIYPISKLEDIDIIYVSTIFDGTGIITDENFKILNDFCHDNNSKLFETLKNVSFKKTIAIKTNLYENNPQKLHMLVY